jgi:hypothetical protein
VKRLCEWTFWLEGKERETRVRVEGWTWFDAREQAAILIGVAPQEPKLKWKGEPFRLQPKKRAVP